MPAAEDPELTGLMRVLRTEALSASQPKVKLIGFQLLAFERYAYVCDHVPF